MNYISKFFFVFFLYCGSLLSSEKIDTIEYLQILHEIHSVLEKNYIDKVDELSLYKGAIKGMVKSLKDPYTQFLDKTEFKRFKEDESGSFGGLGIEVSFDKGEVIVVSPIDDTPAMKAGILPNDRIMSIDGVLTKNLKPDQSINRLRGKVDTSVKIQVLRENIKNPIDYTITRKVIKIKYIKSNYFKTEKIAYIRLNQFLGSNATYKNFKKQLENNIQKDTKGLIIDLRYNPGGLLNLAVKFSDLFLMPGKKIVSIKKKNEKPRVFYSNKLTKKWTKIPMVVLINKGSASASEIFAGAMQDHKRATIIGQTSFGKGSVQNIIPLSHDTAIRVTIKKYYTPNDRLIQGKGISPDIKVKRWSFSTKDKFFLLELQELDEFKDFIQKNNYYTDESFQKLKKLTDQKSYMISDEALDLFYRSITRSREKTTNLKTDKPLQAAIKYLQK